MFLKSITEDTTLALLKSVDVAVSKQAAKQSLVANESGQAVQPQAVQPQAVQPQAVDAHFNNKVSPLQKLSPETGIKKSARTMSHVVEVYNLQGKARTKFMDSKNNVIYQIPSEMVAKLEDQMLDLNTSTSTKG